MADDDHPYGAFCYLLGRTLADYSLAFEDLVGALRETIADLLGRLDFLGADVDRLVKLVTPTKTGGWRAYADEEWYQAHESACERTLRDFLS